MSTNIVLPNLTNWTEQHLTSIFNATNQTNFTSAVNAFLSDKVAITVNGVSVSRADFVNNISAEKFDEQSATVTFSGAVEVPADSNNPITAGSVGVFYKASIVEGIRVLGAPVIRQVTASLNVVIAQDPDVPQPKPSPIHGFFDGRRVMSLNQVSIDGPAPIQNA
ncbi:hypothetical protein CPB84DRAFT_1677137 [Gymnopilus junonius]|uniref:Uncharacterized protein n=1 Tax=Gymnopilus junonius TaxID=109634 RepID=A0A9P5NPZ4_GYMJU|nr:hypothetical protein CPB84DRAFT_1677137 [Gymnopilus junonius]